MKIRINNLLPIIVMFLLAALTLWLRQAAEQLPGAESRESNDPEAVVTNLSIMKLGENGMPRYSMSAGRMLHFASDDSTVLEIPKFERRDADGTRTTITATKGKLTTAGGDQAFFYGNVRLDRVAPSGRLQAQTEYLHVVPDREVIETDRQVTISNGSFTLSGTGMQIDKSRGQVSLQSQVKGSYHAPRK